MATVSDAFYDILRHHGVKAVFGNPGSNELSFLTGLPDDIPYYLVLQEGVAIGIADGFAQATNSIGFLNLHAASGTGNAMGSMTNTAACHTPMVIMAGQQARRYVPVDAMQFSMAARAVHRRPPPGRPLGLWTSARRVSRRATRRRRRRAAIAMTPSFSRRGAPGSRLFPPVTGRRWRSSWPAAPATPPWSPRSWALECVRCAATAVGGRNRPGSGCAGPCAAVSWTSCARRVCPVVRWKRRAG
ncbi:thiamine pyrophosphate-binding protein [Streptomyces nigra]|uniref:thiamine pyrophosphate-binding protein n=1 Tax=Streptomyces nigra TaxID=1827580 RepID=UPI003696D51E